MGTNVLAPADRRLNSWKEIGSFFSRDERTVKRWEARRGLPVHRIPGPGNTKVFGYVGELTAWLNSGSPAWPSTPQRIAATFGAAPQSRRAPHPQVHELCLAGMYSYNLQTPQAVGRALDHFTQAIAIDRADARSHVGLGTCYALLHGCGVLPSDMAYAHAGAAAERAIALDDRLSEAHSLLGAVRFHGSWDVAGALAAFERALSLGPDSWQAHHRYATVLLHIGRFAAALDAITAAQAINPVYRPVLADKGRILFHVGRQAGAAILLTQLADVAPDFLWPHAYLAELHLGRRQYAAYLEASLRAATLRGDERRCAVLRIGQGALDRGGAAAMARAMRAEWRRRHGDGGRATAYDLAQAEALAGDPTAALAQLRRAVAQREPAALNLRIDPAFAALHDHADFKRLIVALGFDPP